MYSPSPDTMELVIGVADKFGATLFFKKIHLHTGCLIHLFEFLFFFLAGFTEHKVHLTQIHLKHPVPLEFISRNKEHAFHYACIGFTSASCVI